MQDGKRVRPARRERIFAQSLSARVVLVHFTHDEHIVNFPLAIFLKGKNDNPLHRTHNCILAVFPHP